MAPLLTYIVEDNAVIVDTLVEALKEEVAEVKVTGHSGTEVEASRWLHAHGDQWHLAIVDLFLQGGNGLQVLAACRDRKPHQKVVVLTNYATTETRRQAEALGADAVFDKSTELDELIDYCHLLTVKMRTQSAHVR